MKAEPTVGCVELKKTNDYLVIACSAVWNVLTPKEVFAFLKATNNRAMGDISKALIERVKELYRSEQN